MSIVLMPRGSQIDAHDIARAVSRLSVVSYSIAEDDEEDKDNEENSPSGEPTGVVISPSDGQSSAAEQLESVLTTLQHTSSFKQSTKKPSKLKFYFQKFLNFYDRLGLKHVSPILFLVLYSLIGAALFCIIEKPHELNEMHEYQLRLDRNREDAIKQLAAILNSSNSIDTKMRQTRDLIIWYEDKLLVPNATLTWDMWGALFYVGTIYTTIGYGNIYCKTTGGRILTILYAIFGIPLVLAILSDLGTLFCKWINSFWKSIVSLVGAKTKKVHQKVNKTILKKRSNNGDAVHYNDPPRYGDPPTSSIPVGTLIYEDDVSGQKTPQAMAIAMTDNGKLAPPSNDNDDSHKNKDGKNKPADDDVADVPVSMAIAVTVLWLFICSSWFLVWETNWSYFQAVYFFFISLSTIGLGDIVPDRPRLMVINFGLVIIGLSLVSMTISVIQQNIESFLYRVLKMIQDEYAAAVEAGLLPKEDDIVDKVLAKQPWYMRKMAPMVMTQNQKRQLYEIVNFSHPITVSTGIQCSSVTHIVTQNVASQANLPIVSEMFTQTDEEEFEELEQTSPGLSGASGETPETQKPPPIVTVDTAVQTATVPSIYLQEENLTPIDISNVTCVSTKDEGVQVTCRSGVGALTIIEASYATNLVDAIIQTDDSYLKLAKKLEALKVNRAKSLAIWASPVSKRPRPTPVMESTPE